jgi:hypothetical protein
MCLFNGPQSLNYRDSICALPGYVPSLGCVCVSAAAAAVQQIGPFSVGKIIDSLASSRCAAAHFRKTPLTPNVPSLWVFWSILEWTERLIALELKAEFFLW